MLAVLQQLQELQGAGAGMLEKHQVHVAEAAGTPLRCENLHLQMYRYAQHRQISTTVAVVNSVTPADHDQDIVNVSG